MSYRSEEGAVAFLRMIDKIAVMIIIKCTACCTFWRAS